MDRIKPYLHYIIEILLGIALIIALMNGCNSGKGSGNDKPKVDKQDPTVVRDTMWRDTIIFREIKVPVPVEVVISRIDTIIRDSVVFVDTSDFIVNQYRDSIQDTLGVIKWSALVNGHLLGLNASYEGKYPSEVIRWREKNVIRYKGGLYITSGIGYNGDLIRGDIGGQWVTRKGKIFGYEYDFVNGFHSIKTGLRLF